MRHLFFILLIAKFSFVFAQGMVSVSFKKPEFNEIKTKATSTEVWQPLIARFYKSDSISKEEYRTLYFGSVFRTKGITKGALRKEQVIFSSDKKGCEMLFFEPLSNCKELGNCDNLYACQQHFIGFLEAIISSGDGLTPQTAYYIVDLNHTQNVLNLLDLKSKSQKMLDNNILQINLLANDLQLSRIYFNVSHLISDPKPSQG